MTASSTSPHICFVSPKIWPVISGERTIQSAGGAEMRQSILAHAFVRDGFRVSVITMDYGQPNGAVIDGITVLHTHKLGEGLPLIRFFHPGLSGLWSAMTQADADIYFQSSAAFYTAAVGLFSKVNGRGFIYSGACDKDFERDQIWKLFQGRRGWQNRQLYLLGLYMADVIVAQHTGQADACRRWFKREAKEVPNCYAPPQDATSTQDGVVLWVGTIKPLKRPEMFLELARNLPHLRFRMVGGPGQEREDEVYERTKAAAAGIPNLDFIGFVPFVDVEAHFNDARVFVNTSEFEGFPNTFLQSWARGIPTVSFVDCGARETGRPVGFISKSVEEMKQAVSRLCEDNSLRIAEGQRARVYFENRHSLPVAMKLYRALFESLLASKGRI